MHIQSNNTAPLTLQWCLLMLQLATFLNSTDKSIENFFSNIGYKNFNLKNAFDLLEHCGIDINPLRTNEISKIMWLKLDRTFLNSLSSSLTFAVKDFGRIGSLDTDMVAKLFMADSTRLRVKSLGYGMFMSEDILKKMIKERKDLHADFELFTSYYYRGKVKCRFYIVMPMDMSHAHYWGNFGLPVYFPLGTDKYYYINDYLLAISLIDNVIYHFTQLDQNRKDVINRIKERGPVLKIEIQKKVDMLKKQIENTFKSLGKELEKKKEEINKELKNIKDNTIVKKILELLKKLEETEKENRELQEKIFKELEEGVNKFCSDEINRYLEYKNEEHREGFFYLDNYIGHRIEEIQEKVRGELIQHANQFKKNIGEALTELVETLQKAKKGITGTIRALVEKTQKKANEVITYFKDKLPAIRDKVVQTIDSIKRALQVYLKGGGKLIPYDIDIAGSQEYFHFENPVQIDYRSKPRPMDDPPDWEEYTEKYLKKKYNHFLEIAPGNERSDFEDYHMQINHTTASTLRYAFDLLPFFHTDPRRFFKGETYTGDLIENIREHHGFFLTQRKEVHKLSLTPLEFTGDYLEKDLFSDKNKTKYNDVFDKVLPKGVFWGLKMYTELGYPPNLGDTRDPDIQKSFKYQFKGQFDHMTDIFKKCVKQKIPITCHASSKGMTIADT